MKKLTDRELLNYMMDVSREVADIEDLDELLDYVMGEVFHLTEATAGYIVLVEDDGQLDFQLMQDSDGNDLENDADLISTTLLSQVVNSGEPLVLRDAMRDERFAQAMSVQNLQIRSIMCLPLISRNRVIGAIYIENRTLDGRFDQDDLPVMEVFASQVAMAIERAALNWRD
ncbi:MAG TPA: GAF domain-containing protein [Anaerolineae bacterium]|nr:GAF domain-containing protein [Anaerolineae bacterium]